MLGPMFRGGPAALPIEVRRVRRKLGDVGLDSFFQYGINFAFTVGTEALPGNIPIQSDAHFMCQETVYDLALTSGAASVGVVPAQISGGALIQITDGATQRAMQNIQIPISTFAGSAQRPFVWPFTHLFKANTSISLLVTGTSVAMALVTLRLVFVGFKVPFGTATEYGLP